MMCKYTFDFFSSTTFWSPSSSSSFASFFFISACSEQWPNMPRLTVNIHATCPSCNTKYATFCSKISQTCSISLPNCHILHITVIRKNSLCQPQSLAWHCPAVPEDVVLPSVYHCAEHRAASSVPSVLYCTCLESAEGLPTINNNHMPLLETHNSLHLMKCTDTNNKTITALYIETITSLHHISKCSKLQRTLF